MVLNQKMFIVKNKHPSATLSEGQEFASHFFLILALQTGNKPLGFGFDVNIHPGTCLATAVRQLGFLQIAAAHVGDINERNPPQHKEQ